MKDMSINSDSLILSGDKCFFSLQGEGATVGKPAIFLRLHLCNLQCSFCDTPYTWNKNDERFYSEPIRWSIKKTVNNITQYSNCNRLVFTGGEPLLQKEAIKKVMKILNPVDLTSSYNPNWYFEFETNGTLPPFDMDFFPKRIQYNISPKLENSDNSKELRYKSKVLKQYLKYNSYFKFVVIDENDIPEIEAIIEECQIPNKRVILMPEGVTQEAITKHGRLVAELCKEKGWRLVPRLHIMLWGNKRSK